MADDSRSPVPCVQILRLPQVCKAAGLGRSMIYQLESERRFPWRVRIGARAVGWVEAEVQIWLAGRVEHHRVSERREAARITATRELLARAQKPSRQGRPQMGSQMTRNCSYSVAVIDLGSPQTTK